MDARTPLCLSFQNSGLEKGHCTGLQLPSPSQAQSESTLGSNKDDTLLLLNVTYHRDPVPCCAISQNFQSTGILLPVGNADNYRRKELTLSRQKDGRIVTFRKNTASYGP